jgi:hypothetical protein
MEPHARKRTHKASSNKKNEKKAVNELSHNVQFPQDGVHWWWAGFFAEIFLAFLFWSMVAEFPATVWFYPLVKMGITGKEAIAIVFFSPILLSVQKIRRFVRNHQALSYALSLIGILAYLALDLDIRAVLLAAGVAWSFITFFGVWWISSPRRQRAGSHLSHETCFFFIEQNVQLKQNLLGVERAITIHFSSCTR